MEIKQIQFNKSSREKNDKIEYIVIHDTGNTDKGANADAHFKFFNTQYRKRSADFFVDSEKVIQVNNFHKFFTWHCGDGYGKYGITNRNSIGIEICINSDGIYHQALINAEKLTAELLIELDLPIQRVVRHYDASRKICPKSMSKNNWKTWYEFLGKVKEYKDEKERVAIDFNGKIAYVKAKNIENHWKANIRDVFEKLGYAVSWDNAKKQIIVR